MLYFNHDSMGQRLGLVQLGISRPGSLEVTRVAHMLAGLDGLEGPHTPSVPWY